MKELYEIIEEAKRAAEERASAAIATVVQVSGGACRPPGSRLLIPAKHAFRDFIGTGRLERALWEQAQELAADKSPRVVEYSGDEVGDDFDLRGKGKVKILIEWLPSGASCNYINFLTQCIHSEKNAVLATVFYVEGDLASSVGERLVLDEDGGKEVYGDETLMDAVMEDARSLLHKGRSQVKRYELGAGSADVLLELLRPLPLVIFGAGDDSIPLVRLGREIGWHVVVVDTGSAGTSPDIPSYANDFIVSRPEDIPTHVPLTSRTVVVVMTHNYLDDLKLLKMLLPSPIRYLGVLGPRQRTERLLRNLKDQGFSATVAQLQRLYNPIGVDIGAETPLEIAIAIIAEIQAILNSRSAGLLRDCKGPIRS